MFTGLCCPRPAETPAAPSEGPAPLCPGGRPWTGSGWSISFPAPTCPPPCFPELDAHAHLLPGCRPRGRLQPGRAVPSSICLANWCPGDTACSRKRPILRPQAGWPMVQTHVDTACLFLKLRDSSGLTLHLCCQTCVTLVETGWHTL